MIEHETIPGEKLSRLSLTSEGDTPINVLLVEDSRTVRAQLRQYISMLDNVTLLEAETLAEARTILEARSHELFCAILDLTLPDANGLDTVEAVRAYDVPIIVLTGSADTFLRQAVLDKRVIDYMFKNGAAAVEDVAYLIGRLRQNLSMKVLVVDDSPDNLLMLEVCLRKRKDLRPVFARNGKEALAKFNRFIFSLVLTDMEMPQMDGYTAVGLMRSSPGGAAVPVVALTAHYGSAEEQRCFDAGCDDCLAKPVSMIKLLGAVKKYLGAGEP